MYNVILFLVLINLDRKLICLKGGIVLTVLFVNMFHDMFTMKHGSWTSVDLSCTCVVLPPFTAIGRSICRVRA